MPNKFKILDEERQDDTIVQYYLAQEMDKHSHEMNLARFNAMLEVLTENTEDEKKWKNWVTELRDQTIRRLAEVDSIIEATDRLNQLPSQERIDDAKTRLKAKENK